jgi:glycosyltransferase involved in cell wall biosynthesis
MKIVIFTQSPLSKAPRVVKEANCLVNCGFEVTVFGLWHDEKVLDADFSILSKNISYKAGANLLGRNFNTYFLRAERRFWRELIKFFDIQTKRSLGYGYSNYLSKLKVENADLYIGHQEMSMALAKDLLQMGYNVAFDFEDYHSHDLLPEDRIYRPIDILKSLERFLLNHAKFCTTTSDVLAKELANTYCSKTPTTVYNSFYNCNDYEGANISGKIISLVWISQVIGPGRGLDLIIDAVRMSKSQFELTLIGKKDEYYWQKIQKLIPRNLVVHFTDFIPSSEISKKLSEYDLGIAFEESLPLNRDLTITNKIFHYLNSGIAIIATNTKGQIEISNKTENAVVIVEPQAQAIADILDRLFTNRDELKKMKEKSSFYGKSLFDFQNEEVKICGLVNSVIVRN